MGVGIGFLLLYGCEKSPESFLLKMFDFYLRVLVTLENYGRVNEVTTTQETENCASEIRDFDFCSWGLLSTYLTPMPDKKI